MMNFRLAQPEVLIDLNNIANLSFINRDDNGGLRIGAMARHAQVEREPLVAELAPLIYEAMPKIATSQIRSRGTFGGSIAHADPSAELVAISVALDGRFRLLSLTGERWFSANEFFLGMFTTQIEPEELLVEINIPPLPPRSGWSLVEVARRPHDFAMVGVAAVVTLDDRGHCQHARIVYLSVGDGPVVAHRAAELLTGQQQTPDSIRAAAETAAAEDVDPSSDIHASAAYRRHLVKILTSRALDQAFQRARTSSS
jgi:carbon-monoxide dehydrogenase medium subunit